MRIQCSCGKLQIEHKTLPKGTPGRLVCYCDDCQKFLLHLGRTDLLDTSGGTEVIPVYPSDITILSGQEGLFCLRLSPKGIHRFVASCCNSPVGNTHPGTPWLGVHRSMFTFKDAQAPERHFGPVKGRIMGKFAKGQVPSGTPAKMSLSSAIVVLPFMLKGAIGRKGKPSPLFQSDGKTPICSTKVLTDSERDKLQVQWEKITN